MLLEVAHVSFSFYHSTHVTRQRRVRLNSSRKRIDPFIAEHVSQMKKLVVFQGPVAMKDCPDHFDPDGSELVADRFVNRNVLFVCVCVCV